MMSFIKRREKSKERYSVQKAIHANGHGIKVRLLAIGIGFPNLFVESAFPSTWQEVSDPTVVVLQSIMENF
jgi:hypothetical protein